ncbi:MAG: ABC transporter substrate-binding protein [Eubacterium sp.]|nr:ABC transporter substrate-binding protein [Eubacterium sp.]
MKQKKLIALLICALMTVAALTGCGGKKEPEKEPENLTLSDTVNIACMNGPTGMAMAPLMDTENYNIKVYQSPADALPEIIKGDIDIACVPSNMAAVLYNKTGGNIICLSPMVMGVLHILGNNTEISAVEELKGKTIISSGQGGTPEYALKVVLGAHGLEMGKDVKVEWLASHADVNTKLLKDEGTVAMVPEPFVSTALTKGGDKIKDIFDMNTLWSEATSQDFPMGVLITRTDFMAGRLDDLKVVLKDLDQAIDYVNSGSDDAVQTIVDKGFLADAEITKKAIPNCGLCLYASDIEGSTFEEGAEIMKTFNETMFKADPKAVGGALPGDDMYLLGLPEVNNTKDK